MRIKITILFIFTFLFSLLSMFIKGKYAPLNILWLRIVYDICSLILAFSLILKYKKLLICWKPKNKQQEMRFLSFLSFCVTPLLIFGVFLW